MGCRRKPRAGEILRCDRLSIAEGDPALRLCASIEPVQPPSPLLLIFILAFEAEEVP